ncbi:MAG TPA: precorrin-3B C(17)-methyltransferase [Acidimicrobiia bacterium]|nr:precorrin-3B C(17)-methyltransferase [Acidimicrobiia bacterium]
MTYAGRLAVVGLGPGAPAWRSPEASERLACATDVVGYGPYLQHVGELAHAPMLHESDNRQEAERARFALGLAAEGRDVVLVSSGDPGVFAMATAVIEALHDDEAADFGRVEITIVPGITAASAAAARIGAPLGHDFCCISLSDVLKPWDVVEARLRAAAGADFVLALYNPISSQRPWQLGRALDVVGEARGAETPVVLARDVGRPGEAVVVTTLGETDPADVDMRTVLIVGSSTTRRFDDLSGRTWVYTPRTYPAER